METKKLEGTKMLSHFEISAKEYHMINAGIANIEINYNIGDIKQKGYLTMNNINSISGQIFTKDQSHKWLCDNNFVKFVTHANTAKTQSQKRRERRNKLKTGLKICDFNIVSKNAS